MYDILSEEHQQAAYRDGYREGELTRKGYLRVSQYMQHAAGDFPRGSWSQQHAQGYCDGLVGLRERCVFWK